MDQNQINAFNIIFQRLYLIEAAVKRGAGYAARQEIEALKKEIGKNSFRFEPFGFKVYSQNDEDGILEEIFRRLSLARGAFCEIGVENGLECNSLYLLHKGWKGVWLEGNPEQQQPIEEKFRQLIENGRLALSIGYVTPDNLDETMASGLARIGVDVDALDFLSIDIDGMDIYLFEALRVRPKVVCIEYNGKFPPPLKKRPVFDPTYTWRGSDYMGSSLSEINASASQMGYKLVATNLTGANAFFVRNDLLNDNFDQTLAEAQIYNPPRYYLFLDNYSNSVGHPPDFGPYSDLIAPPPQT